ncbi:hypothetical protein BC748_0963 [Flavobacterium dankookense]|uniref:Immunity protein 17 of polymorphic toxin system n=1 Tax=Flavobacterium dankookense TaxID=706186 RepID=A0A4V3CSC0_9FLAO|nr:hypothetical protein BC748_0963 [Flavobacterium dankookense]
MATIGLIICVLILIGLIYYHVKYKKPFVNYDDNIYEKMTTLRFYFMLIFLILVLIFLHLKKYNLI